MDVFSLRDEVIKDYGRYVTSFLETRDPRVEKFVDREFASGALWPEPLIQLNPAFEPEPTIDEFVAEGVLHTCPSASGSSPPFALRVRLAFGHDTTPALWRITA